VVGAAGQEQPDSRLPQQPPKGNGDRDGVVLDGQLAPFEAGPRADLDHQGFIVERLVSVHVEDFGGRDRPELAHQTDPPCI
jgi:hypothetical protein